MRNRASLGVPRRDSLTLFGRVPGGASLLSDSFNDRTLLGSTDGFWYGTGGGIVWTAEAGTWSCSGGKLVATGSSPGGLGWLCKADCGAANIRLAATIGHTPIGSIHRVRFRIEDASNWVSCDYLTGNLIFSDCVSGSVTNRGSASTGYTPALGDVIVITANGDLLSADAYRNGAKVTSTPATATISNFNTATSVGFRAPATTAAWDRLAVWRAVTE